VRLWSATTWNPLCTIDLDYKVQDMQIFENTLVVSGNRGVIAFDIDIQKLRTEEGDEGARRL
jgi:hypothetical protein